MDNKVDTLKKYGFDFQVKTLSAFLADGDFLERVYDSTDPNFFESEAHHWIVERINEYFTKYKKVPSMEYFKVEVGKVQTDSLKTSIIKNLKSAYVNMKSTDLNYIKDEFLLFCQNQSYKIAAINILNLVAAGEYDKTKAEIEKAANAGVDRNIGHDYFADFEKRMEKITRNPRSTGFGVIDNITGGGLGNGDLGVIVANAGAGKSWLLSKIGSQAIKDGLGVLHFTLELSDTYVGYRYDSIFTGFEVQDIIDNKDTVWKTISGFDGSLAIKQYPTKRATVDTLYSHAQRCLRLGRKIDLIIVDYADILKPIAGFYQRDDLIFTGIYEDLRGMAGELKLPIWTASQSNREAIKSSIIEADGVSDSYGKVQTGDLIISLSRRSADKVHNVGRVHIMKNRYGPDGMTFPARINTSTGQFDLYPGDSKEGIDINNLVADAEKILKSGLRDKYKSSLDKTFNRGNKVDVG